MALTGKRRVSKDKFYTAPEVALQQLQLFKHRFPDVFRSVRVFVEPSIGSGAFALALRQLTEKPIIGFDLDPKIKSGDNIKVHKQDFLALESESALLPDANPAHVMCVGNPPYGNGWSLASKFLRQAMSFAHHVLFIVPVGMAFSKQNRAIPDPHFHIAMRRRLRPRGVFLLEDGTPLQRKLYTAVVYYQYREKLRRVPPKPVPSRFRFVKRGEALRKGDYVFFRPRATKVHRVRDPLVEVPREHNFVVRLARGVKAPPISRVREELARERRKLAKNSTLRQLFSVTVAAITRIFNRLV